MMKKNCLQNTFQFTVVVVLLLPSLIASLLESSTCKSCKLRELQRTKFTYFPHLSATEGRAQDSDANKDNFDRARLVNARVVSAIGVGGRFKDVLSTRTTIEPRFIQRFIGEMILATTLQGIAEYQRRGTAFLKEIDYVVAGVLTAILGKGIAAFRSAPSLGAGTLTNAFQYGDYTPLERLLSFIITPAPKLFISGAFAGGLGYSLSRILTLLRTEVFKVGAAAAPVVPIMPAAIYTGCFLVFVSGPSYQILSGLLEQRIVDRVFRSTTLNVFIVSILRILRSILASALAIRGMQLLGLQKSV